MITQSGNDQPAKESEDAEFTSRCTQKRRKRRTSCTSVDSAKANGISTSYIDQLGAYVEIRDEVLVSVLRALGVDASTDEAVTKSYEATVRKTQTTLVPSTIVKFLGTPTAIPIRPAGRNVTLRLLLEDGTAYAGNLAMCLLAENDGTLRLNLPDDIPSGYHTLRINAGDA